MPAQIVNRDDLMSAMHDIGRTFGLTVRQYTATAHAPFESYLSIMARTGILVSRHGPFLSNSIFLPPGRGDPLPGMALNDDGVPLTSVARALQLQFGWRQQTCAFNICHQGGHTSKGPARSGVIYVYVLCLKQARWW